MLSGGHDDGAGIGPQTVCEGRRRAAHAQRDVRHRPHHKPLQWELPRRTERRHSTPPGGPGHAAATPPHLVDQRLVAAEPQEEGLEDLDGHAVALGLELQRGGAELGACTAVSPSEGAGGTVDECGGGWGGGTGKWMWPPRPALH